MSAHLPPRTSRLRHGNRDLPSQLLMKKIYEGNETTNGLEHFVTSCVCEKFISETNVYICLLYTSPSPRDGLLSRMPSSA